MKPINRLLRKVRSWKRPFFFCFFHEDLRGAWVDEDNHMLTCTHRICMITLWRFYCGSFVCWFFQPGPERGRGWFIHQKKNGDACSVKKCLQGRRSTLDCELHSAISPLWIGSFESSCCEELSEVYFRFAQLWQDPGFFFKVPKIRVTSARTIFNNYLFD